MLETQMIAYIAETESFYPADAATRPIEEQRRLYDAYAAHMTPPRPPGVTSEDAVLELPGRALRLRAYRDAAGGGRGVVVYLHGGGYVVGGLDSHDRITASFAARTGATVVSVDYRLAPEHPYPAPFEDARDAVLAVLGGATPFDLPRGRLVLAGDSAGGTLCAAVSLALRDSGRRQADGMILFYPGLAPDPTPPARDEHAAAPMLSLADLRWYKTTYLAGRAPTPFSSPLLAGSLAGLAPALLLPVEIDPLRDDAVLFHRRIVAEGGAAELMVGAGLVHGSLRAMGRSPGVDALVAKAMAFARERLG